MTLLHWLYRNLVVVTFVLVVIIGYAALHAWTNEQDARVHDVAVLAEQNTNELNQIQANCRSFVEAHNGLVVAIQDTLRQTLIAHAFLDPQAIPVVQAQIDAYGHHLEDPAACG